MLRLRKSADLTPDALGRASVGRIDEHAQHGLAEVAVELGENTLERLLPPVKEMAIAHGDFPVIVAGGIYSHEDIRRFLALGADGVQMGTRFLATEKSSASDAYKRAVVRARPEDMLIANAPGSPCLRHGGEGILTK